jgi:hypothetical protein
MTEKPLFQRFSTQGYVPAHEGTDKTKSTYLSADALE